VAFCNLCKQHIRLFIVAASLSLEVFLQGSFQPVHAEAGLKKLLEFCEATCNLVTISLIPVDQDFG
jgi:hypothetical protein